MLAESLHRLSARLDALILYATDITLDSDRYTSSVRLL